MYIVYHAFEKEKQVFNLCYRVDIYFCLIVVFVIFRKKLAEKNLNTPPPALRYNRQRRRVFSTWSRMARWLE